MARAGQALTANVFGETSATKPFRQIDTILRRRRSKDAAFPARAEARKKPGCVKPEATRVRNAKRRILREIYREKSGTYLFATKRLARQTRFRKSGWFSFRGGCVCS